MRAQSAQAPPEPNRENNKNNITMKRFLFCLMAMVAIVGCTDDGPDDGGSTGGGSTQPQTTITLTTTALNFTSEGGSQNVTFTSSGEWTAQVLNDRANDWCKLTPASGAAGNGQITVTVAANATTDERSASIILKSGTVQKTIKVTQKQKDALTVTASKFEVAFEGGTVAIEVKANIDFSYVVDGASQSWIKYQTTRAMKTSTLVFDIAENDSRDKRQGTVTISSGALKEVVTIYQEGAKPTIVISKSEYVIGSEGGSVAVEVKSNVDVSVELPSDVEWLSESTTRAMSTNTYYFDVAENTGYDQRSATIVFTNKADNLTEEVMITQTQKDVIVLAKSEYEFDVDGGELDFEILTNVDVTVKTSATWIKQVTTRALDCKMLFFDIAANDAQEAREGTITISGGDVMQIVTVKQMDKDMSEFLEIERQALIDLYNATDGDNWIYNTNWCSDKPVSEWFGVTCFAYGGVSSIGLVNNNLRGELPSSIGNITRLESLNLQLNHLTGNLPASICLLPNLYEFDVSNNNLSGSIPAELSNLMSITRFSRYLKPLPDLRFNQFSGEIPEQIYNHSKWRVLWPSIVLFNSFNINTLLDNGISIPGPQFEGFDICGVEVSSEQIYKENEYTLIYDYPYVLGYSPIITNSLAYVRELYKKYSNNGLKIIMFTRGVNADIEQFVQKYNIPWTCCNISLSTTSSNQLIVENGDMQFYPTNIWNVGQITIFDSDGMMVAANPGTYDENVITQFLSTHLIADEVDYYTSTDYSQDGVVTTLQTATKGAGIDVVLMGDAYSDRQIADGTYKADMENLYNNLFTEEPYKSFEDHFNVHYVNVVSATEGYDYGDPALSGYFGNGTEVGGNNYAVFNYALKAISEEEMDEALLIVAMNSNNYAGTCYMYYPQTSLGYGNGVSIAYFPKGGDQTTFAQLLHHEACGHGFAKLADEYAYESMGAVPSEEVTNTQTQQTDWGWWKNVDFTSDVTAVRWAKFISDSRYANEKLGAYEGAMTYWTGVWRPTENSIMRYNTGGFNAPSREAIYYRIHKLAYGDEWTSDYETFVEYDEINRTTTTTTQSVPVIYKPTAPPVVMQKNWKDELR